MLKKIQTLFIASLLVVGSMQTMAQDNSTLPPDMSEETEAIEATLDSLTNLHYFDLRKRSQTVKRLNKYGFRPEDVPTYDDSVYAYRIDYLERDMPFEFNPYVKAYIDLYAVRKRNLTEKVLGLSQYYFPVFEEALEKAGLPHSLKYLAVVESALNPNAVSRSGATGLWQFMYGTAKMYNLRVNYYYDERRDPYAATMAAVAFFKDLYSIYKDWMLVLAAYNCGPGNVNKAIRKSGGKRDYWSLRPYLPVETRGYVPAFIAVSYVMNFAAEHNLYPTPMISLPSSTDLVTVEGPVYLRDLCPHLDMDEPSLSILNPALKLKYIPQSHDNYPMRIPAKLVSGFEKKKEQIFAGIRKSAETSTVATRSSDSDVNRQIIIANSLSTPKKDDKNDDSQEKSSAQPNEDGLLRLRHEVIKGDNLRRIAEHYNVTIEDLRTWNQLPNNVIRIGQELDIYTKEAPKYALSNSDARSLTVLPDDQPAVPIFNRRNRRSIERQQHSRRHQLADNDNDSPRRGRKEKKGGKTYTVKNGDSLWSIAERTGQSVESIKKANKLGSGNKLKKGQKLKIPKA